MKWTARTGINLISSGFLQASILGVIFLFSILCHAAETCETGTEMNPAARSALESTAKRYFDMAARGDSASLKQNAIPELVSSFSGIETAVNDHKDEFAGAQSTVLPPYLLEADGNAPIARAEFFCGIYNSPDRVGFVIPNLAPGKYGVVIQHVTGKKEQYAVSMILQQVGNDWKLGGYYVRQTTIGGHEAQWFWDKARQFKSQGQVHNAYFYYIEARQLLAPVDFMGTPQLDKIYDETQQSVPNDMPVNGPVNVTFGGKNYKLTQVFPTSVGSDLDLVVRYDVPDISNTNLTFNENMAVIKGIVGKYPEFRDAFAGVVARAVNPSGQDYGSLLAMKDIK